MEENDIDIIENEGINMLIHDTFISMDENTPMDNIHDVHLIDKVYTDSKTIILSTTILLLVNLKVLNNV
jgi:hypothetical protein